MDNDCDRLVDENEWTAGELMVTEIMVNPAAVADNLENGLSCTTDQTVSYTLNGLVIQSGTGENHQLMADDGFPVAPGDVVVMGLNDNTFVNGGVTLDYVYDRVVLSNEEMSFRYGSLTKRPPATSQQC